MCPQASFATTSTHRGGVPTGATVPPLPEREGFISQAAQYLLEAEYFYRTTGMLQVCAGAHACVGGRAIHRYTIDRRQMR